jgi:hypothetical protein
MKTTKQNSSNKIARTTIGKVCGEYVVKAYDVMGKRIPAADYFTNCKQDAKDTARVMVEGFKPKTAMEKVGDLVTLVEKAQVKLYAMKGSAGFNDANRELAELEYALRQAQAEASK